MAATRNKNTPGNYCLDQKQFSDRLVYTTYVNSSHGEAFDTRTPGNGLLPGQIPWNKMSSNAPDVESFLFGINATNLVNPAPCFVPDLTQLHDANIFKKETIYIPEPLVIEKNQRPFPCP
jgi:hypothetical protein